MPGVEQFCERRAADLTSRFSVQVATLPKAIKGGRVNAEEVVRAELQSWSSLDVAQIMVHFAPDATWLPGFGFPTSSGYDEIRGAVESFLGAMTSCDNEIIYLAVTGNVVLTERVDHLIIDGETLDAPGMGTFEVSGDKITAWRDYFDSSPPPELAS
jgi:limonene-1,2-epoxide hydrolase